MYTIKAAGKSAAGERLLAPTGLTSSDFDQLATDLGQKPRSARKKGFVSARIAKVEERVETHWNGKETSDVAKPGDVIVTNLSPQKEPLRDAVDNTNVYVIRAARFPELYERDKGATEFGDVYRAKGVVESLFLKSGFEIFAPWGQLQIADAGYIVRNGAEVYGNNKETFEATYQFV